MRSDQREGRRPCRRQNSLRNNMTCQRKGWLEMVAGHMQCHLGNGTAEGLGSKNTIEPKAFNSPSWVFIKDTREALGGR